jgi:TRAP-type C4-dicarboxylate transport system permease small subunit
VEDATEEEALAPEDWLGAALLLGILIVMGLGVFFRYALNDSLTWSEELSRYGLVVVTYVGCIAACRRRSHIRIDAIDLLLPPRARWALALAMQAGLLLFLLYIAWRTWQITGFLRTTISPAIGIPIVWIYGIMLACFLLAALRQGQTLRRMVAEAPR